jgi:hypothetical protein
MADLVRQYADFPLGTADASVIAVAERLGATHIATIDHRHFRRSAPHTATPSTYYLRSDLHSRRRPSSSAEAAGLASSNVQWLHVAAVRRATVCQVGPRR